MSTDRDVAASEADARANKRWLIGIGITLMFGLFGAVMALLSYSRSSKLHDRAVAPGAGATATSAPAGDAPAPRSRGKNKKND